MNPAVTTVGVRLLGPVQVTVDDVPIPVGSRIQRALLAMLALEANRVVGSDRLLDGAWQGESGGTRSALHVHISHLRNLLEPDRHRGRPATVLRSAGGGYLLTVDTRRVDVHEFLRLVGEGLSLRDHDPEAAVAVLRRATDMFAGTPLQDLEDQNFAPPVITRLAESRLEATAARIDAELELEHYTGLPAELAELVAAHPTRETFVRQQMLALVSTGRHPDALRAYASYRSYLREELGLDPSPELQSLEASILAQEPVGRAATSARPTTPAAVMISEVVAARRLWLEHTANMHRAYSSLHQLVTDAVDRAGGKVVDDNGERLVSVFDEPADAVTAAVGCQTATLAADFKVPLSLRVAVASSGGGERPPPPSRVIDQCIQLATYAPAGSVLVPEDALHAVGAAGFTACRYGTIRSHGHLQRTDLYVVEADGLRAPAVLLPVAESLSLPRQSVSLVGRDRELAELRRLVATKAMVSIVGPAGVGKTALAIEVAWSMAHDLDDGAFFVDLSDARPDSVVAVIATTLGIRADDDSALTATLGAVAGRDLLLVLDNCEHVTAAVAELARHCERCGLGLRMLVTSRRATGFRGEHVFPLSPLAVRQAGGDSGPAPAVRLFLERAWQSGYEIGDDPATLERVRRVCAQLDGLPLAVELTAARLRSTSLHGIEQQLASAGPLAAVAGTDQHGRDLAQAIAWSYDLLPTDERATFCHLGVFRGGFSVEAAASVAIGDQDQVLSSLGQLADSSLIMAVENERETRYRALETVRAFAVGRLGDRFAVDRARHRHADYYRKLARTGERELCGPHEASWVSRFVDDFENLIGAFEWYVSSGVPDDAIDMAACLWNFALQRTEGVRFFGAVETAMSSPVFADHPRRSELLGIAANGAWLRGDPLRACELAIASIAAEDDVVRSAGSGRALIPARMALLNAVGSGLGSRAFQPHHHTEAATAFETMHEICQRAGDPYWLVFPYVLAAFARSFAGDHAEARSAASSAVGHATVSGSLTALSWALLARASALQPVDPEPAVDACERSLEGASEIGSQFPAALAVSQLATLSRRAGNHGRAVAHLVDGLQRWDRLGNAPHAWHAVREACLLAAAMGHAASIEPLVSALRAQTLVFPHDQADMRAVRRLAEAANHGNGSRDGPLSLRAALDLARENLRQLSPAATAG